MPSGSASVGSSADHDSCERTNAFAQCMYVCSGATTAVVPTAPRPLMRNVSLIPGTMASVPTGSPSAPASISILFASSTVVPATAINVTRSRNVRIPGMTSGNTLAWTIAEGAPRIASSRSTCTGARAQGATNVLYDRQPGWDAFYELLDTMREVGDRFAGEEWGLTAPDDVAGALRVVSNLLEGGLVGHFEDDPAAPVFRQIVTSTRKSLGDNADAIYFDALVSPEYTCCVRGRMAGAVYVSFTVEAGGPAAASRNGPAGVLNDSDFDIDSEGRFDVVFGGSPRDRNWLALPEGAPPSRPGTTGSRNSRPRSRRVPMSPTSKCSTAPVHCPARRRHDRGRVPARCHLCAHADPRPEAPGDGDQPAPASREPNKFPKPVKPGDHALAAADAAYSMAPFVLGPDEALVITGRWPECRCANVTLWNRHLQTFDYVHRRGRSTASRRSSTPTAVSASSSRIVTRVRRTGSTPRAGRSAWCSGATSSRKTTSRRRTPKSSSSNRELTGVDSPPSGWAIDARVGR